MGSILSNKIFKLVGKIQNYAWGGFKFIPQLLNYENKDNKPCAEYWMGAHPSASSIIQIGNNNISLQELIKDYPTEILTDTILTQFGELPYLYKVLDVNDMLSIQVHPSKEEAIKGFNCEEKLGVPINAFNRNYKDKNHKPEVMIALSEFWLLHGFKQLEAIENCLQEIKEFNILLPLFKKEGLKEMYRFLMEMDQENVDGILCGLLKREQRKKINGELNKSMPGWWATKLFKENDEIKNIDRGVFSIYFFNLVCLQEGEAIFQAAGIPHAYLEGQNIELMANSDNVLRGGLTPKHIDVPELMKHTLFQPIVLKILKGELINNVEKNYTCPVLDFAISKIEIKNLQQYNFTSQSPEIFIAIKGNAMIKGSSINIEIKKGDSFIVLPYEKYSISSNNSCELYKAFVAY